jgi:hypothetical protein
MNHRFPILAALGVLLLALPARAQLELSPAAPFNALTQGTAFGSTNPQPLTQFSSLGTTSGGVVPGAQAIYRDSQGQVVSSSTLSQVTGRVGYAFASGVPRYYLGEEITPPLTKADNTPAPAGYWRAMPVRPGETFANPNGAALTDVNGEQLPNTSGASGTPLPVLATGEYESFYYSPHAERVFASQSGSVEIWWVSFSPEGTGNGAWKFRKETFNVSGDTSVPVRKIYWTEESFDGPRVVMPNGRIEKANPVYTTRFPPTVDEAYRPPGYVENPDASGQAAEVKRTLWYEKMAGIGQISAYNLEGRILVEYLGAEISPGRNIFLGADVVEVVKAATTEATEVELGQQVVPHTGETGLNPAPSLVSGSSSKFPLYATRSLSNGQLVYFAERENLNPDEVLFYWMERADAGIDLLPEGQAPGLSIEWPKYRNGYRFVWPASYSSYAFVTTDPAGSTSANGLVFDADPLPEVVFQDDPNQEESTLDTTSQRLQVNFGNSTDGLNRTLLKFSIGNQVWYQAIYTQAEGRSGYVEPDQGAAINTTATVGARIERPSDRYSLAGAITRGNIHQASAYLDPYSVGVEAAEQGAIIPVNANPTNNTLTVRWFEKVNPPDAAFTAFYVPSKVGRYTVSYPSELGDWRASATMAQARQLHTSTVLKDGRVLVAGGTGASGQALATAELYDPATGTWSSVPSMNTARLSGHTATLLTSGKVLVAGGKVSSTTHTNSAEIFDPATLKWTAVANIGLGNRALHQATLLLDGTVLLSGGRPTGSSLMNDAAIYDPVADTWTPVGNLIQYRSHHAAVLLPNGKVLLAGSYHTGTGTNVVEIYDPVAKTFSSGGNMIWGRAMTTATLLGDGRVLIYSSISGTGYGTAEIYNPATQSSALIATPPVARYNHTATLLPSGKVLIAGGTGGGKGSSEVYDPATGVWSLGAPLVGSRAGHAASLLATGEVLLTGGYLGTAPLSSTDRLSSGDTLVMASNLGAVGLTAEQSAGNLYFQNDPTAVGYNPNEEHALKANDTFWALRDDLNVASLSAAYTSDPFVLIAYTAPDGRPAMRPFRVLREDSRYQFSYPWTAGTRVQGPLPLPLLPLPQMADGSIANTEVAGAADSAAAAGSPASYASFTFEDRKGYKWVYRGPHATSAPTFGMQWYYPMQDGFWIPGLSTPPAAGTKLPFLRPLASGVAQGDAVNGTSLTVTYTPAWPAAVPSLRIAETLTLSKFGLPDVRNQKSAEVLYQQSIAKGGATKPSVTLHDPTRYKMTPLDGVGLTALPDTVQTSVYQGKTYFQGLPPHLQSRFFFDSLASSKGSLILKGEFHDEIAGEDYLDLNVLSATDTAALKALAVNEESSIKAKWESAIDSLKTRVETFVENPAKRGTYLVSTDPALTYLAGATELATLPDSDSARDSYALTATGQGEGYATLMFGDGRNPNLTPAGDPPVMQIIKVVPELYNGDLKVRLSTNPLDEKVSLRHSGDFAAVPENYEFEWRSAPPTANGTQPATYTYANTTYLGNSANAASRQWRYVQSPASSQLGLGDYSVDTLSLPTTVTIRKPGYDASSGLPGLMLRSQSAVDFTSGIPSNLIFSAALGDLDGFVLYINGSVAVVHSNGVAVLDALAAGMVYDLQLIRAASRDDLPNEGSSQVRIAQINGSLWFTVFDPAGSMVVDIAEADLPAKSAEIATLKARLDGLWATTNLLSADKVSVLAAASSITGQNLSESATSGLSATGLPKQFALAESFFIKGMNTIEIGLFTSADEDSTTTVDFRLEGSTRTDKVVAAGSSWIAATGTPVLNNIAIIGGSPTAPLGSPLLAMSDNYFTMRYRAKPQLTDGSTNPAYALTGNGSWTNWTRPVLVEGWIKRVLAAINPFNQRMTDLYNNAVNTDVSLLTQAGTRWEGDIALTLDAVNDYGLIEIYETVLKRGKGISINSGYNYGPANDALLLAAGYLSDLYTILGNEAFADAANPTISIDDSSSSTEINTSRFSFEGQVASVLDEELALLRGRDDFLSPQTTQSPFYNRLFWNYTRGIDAGEALYATNYNIKEKVGSSTEDGSINAADAQRMFPQGHGDAYGHYLTALKGYYQLLTNANYTWVPRTESLNILGNTVAVDYQDERKFAEAASNVARTAEQIVTLSFRQQYRDNPAEGWESFRDGEFNSATANTRYWGLDEWASRAGQGALYHWAVGNAMLPDVDAVNTGIQKIDRSTVPELELLAVCGESFQTTLDNANSHLNPLGLSPGAIAFDIDPAQLRAGKSHYEQVYDRSLAAVLNAKGAFDQAARMTRLLRNQENQVSDANTKIQDEERAFNYQLIDLYGSPYPGDVGPGKTYVQGYSGPDLAGWFVVDRPTGWVDSFDSIIVNGRVPVNVPDFQNIVAVSQNFNYGDGIDKIFNKYTRMFSGGNFDINDVNDAANIEWMEKSITVSASPFGQFSDQWFAGADVGRRAITGRIQQALNECQIVHKELEGASNKLQDDYKAFDAKLRLLLQILENHGDVDDRLQRALAVRTSITATKVLLKGIQKMAEHTDKTVTKTAETVAEAPPKVVGLANDTFSSIRVAISSAASAVGAALKTAALSASKLNDGLDKRKEREDFLLMKDLKALDYIPEELQAAYEVEVEFLRMDDRAVEITQLLLKFQQATENVRTLLAQGERIQLEREIFRKRAAAQVQGYRTNDLTFRAFRNESLEQYRTLFDLASRYTYLAAKSYDYETGLLGSAQGQAVISKIVSSRALGDLSGGKPQATVSTLGDSGLAGTMAQLQADFSVAEGRLGINNPDTNGTLISLRQELFRLRNDPAVTDDDRAWQQTLEQHMVVDLMNDPDVAAQCLNIRKPDGSPVAGMVIPFGSTIQHGKNFFGLPTAAGDHNFSPSNFATKIYSAGVVFDGYLGMDPYAEGVPGAGGPDTNSPNALNATPYVYLIPVGVDKMLAPPLGDTGIERSWRVQDQALPLPYNLGATAFSATQFFSADGTLTEQPWITRKHQAFRPVDDAAFFYGLQKSEFQSSRLVGRSVWNTQWKLVIPAYGLLNDEQTGLTRFAATVDDIKLFFRTYSHSGN